jgi:hypothetical protein
MKRMFIVYALVAGVLMLTLSFAALAQGNSKGKGKSNKPEQSERGKSDKSKKQDDTLWEGFPNERRETDQRGKKDDGQKGSQRFKGLSKRLGIPEQKLAARYEIERAANPDLTYGQFVAAHMIAKNHKGISAGSILDGLRNGRSIGQTLKDRKWKKRQIDRERKRIRDLNRDDRDYDDRDDDWN